ncbi:hypothetical protein HPP92_019584 [Vanilla planifolia]|uniref:Uncharacterized protein n=1 Tax=Vanilla planifolia TaxID=51239 RepID=A0A835Q3G1_VANPL|nr:hypothetical protein HPP92_019584 [Vanilla planifolia]
MTKSLSGRASSMALSTPYLASPNSSPRYSLPVAVSLETKSSSFISLLHSLCLLAFLPQRSRGSPLARQPISRKRLFSEKRLYREESRTGNRKGGQIVFFYGHVDCGSFGRRRFD